MFLDDIKQALRVSHTALDDEIKDLIAAARADLIQSGVEPEKANADGSEAQPIDVLIKRAIIIYCKYNFVSDATEAERFRAAYDMLKIHLALSADYKVGETIAE